MAAAGSRPGASKVVVVVNTKDAWRHGRMVSGELQAVMMTRMINQRRMHAVGFVRSQDYRTSYTPRCCLVLVIMELWQRNGWHQQSSASSWSCGKTGDGNGEVWTRAAFNGGQGEGHSRVWRGCHLTRSSCLMGSHDCLLCSQVAAAANTKIRLPMFSDGDRCAIMRPGLGMTMKRDRPGKECSTPAARSAQERDAWRCLAPESPSWSLLADADSGGEVLVNLSARDRGWLAASIFFRHGRLVAGWPAGALRALFGRPSGYEPAVAKRI